MLTSKTSKIVTSSKLIFKTQLKLTRKPGIQVNQYHFFEFSKVYTITKNLTDIGYQITTK